MYASLDYPSLFEIYYAMVAEFIKERTESCYSVVTKPVFIYKYLCNFDSTVISLEFIEKENDK